MVSLVIHLRSPGLPESGPDLDFFALGRQEWFSPLVYFLLGEIIPFLGSCFSPK